ncbi:hypothetical protein, partial [Agrobacterium salinitolerans]
TEVSLHGINTSRKAKSVTHVSGTKRHLSLKSDSPIATAACNSSRNFQDRNLAQKPGCQKPRRLDCIRRLLLEIRAQVRISAFKK